jgi:hypothetical protein
MTVVSQHYPERQSKIFEKHSQVTGIPFERSEPKSSHMEIYNMTITADCFFLLFGNTSFSKVWETVKSFIVVCEAIGQFINCCKFINAFVQVPRIVTYT